MMTEYETELDALIKKIKKYAKTSVPRSRYEHSIRTAEMCSKLCSLYGLDENLGYLAGVAHDMCKNLDDERMLSLSAKDNNPITELEKEKPSLLHGRAAAVMMKETFGFDDERILEAIANHTFGKVGMVDYEKSLFIADKVEPGREHITSDYLEKLYKLPINRAAEQVLKENMDYLSEKGKKIAPESVRLLHWLKSLG